MSFKSRDHLTIDAITDFKKDIITLSGAVRHGGEFSWREGMRISDLISSRDKLNLNADLDVGLLVREITNTSDIEVMVFDLRSVLSNASGENNHVLQSRDRIIVLSDYQDRAAAISPYIANLERQTSVGELPKIVRSGGAVKYPGEYPLSKGMTIMDLVLNCRVDLLDQRIHSAEISRLDLSDPNRAVTKIIVSDLTAEFPTILEPSDYIEFGIIPEYSESETITLEGEFVFPGTYFFEKGEMPSSVIQRVSGFTDEAFIDGSIFLRESLKTA